MPCFIQHGMPQVEYRLKLRSVPEITKDKSHSKSGAMRCISWEVGQIQLQDIPDNKVHGAKMGPTWVLSAPDGPHVGPMNLPIRDCTQLYPQSVSWRWDRSILPQSPLSLQSLNGGSSWNYQSDLPSTEFKYIYVIQIASELSGLGPPTW